MNSCYLSIDSDAEFNDSALKVFLYQYENLPLYKQYVDLLKIDPYSITTYSQIPCLPIQYFKTHPLIANGKTPQAVFTSSSTGNNGVSRHYVADLSVYRQTCIKIFDTFFANPAEFVTLALLPSYLERKGSSLIEMVRSFMELNSGENGGFFLYNHEDLYQKLLTCKTNQLRTILFGIPFGLLDFCEKYTLDFPELIIIETGGMKGRREEITRSALHEILKKKFNVPHVYSEYGMTELLSQAYYTQKKYFETPSWMRILIRDIHSPLHLIPHQQVGGINVIDLANYNSCSFIATEDLGKNIHNDRSFDVLGRVSRSELRGCNLMVE